MTFVQNKKIKSLQAKSSAINKMLNITKKN